MTNVAENHASKILEKGLLVLLKWMVFSDVYEISSVEL